MVRPDETRRAGLDYLRSVTILLDRIRTAHPTSGLYEAAEVQWWWAQMERTTDGLEQLFWVDEAGRPEAAVIATSWGDSTQLDPLVLPDATSDRIAHVMRRGLDHASEAGIDEVTLEVDRTDDVLRAVLVERGFSIDGNGLVESWMDAVNRPSVSSLPEGYRLLDRTVTRGEPHHMADERRGHVDPQVRLEQTSLYRPELDLAVVHESGEVAAYGLFWFNPTTTVGVVEPMRTEDEHQQRGLARHVLTAGIDRLARAGATRIKICFEPDNPASRHLYLGTGFEPHRENDMFVGPTNA